MVDDEGPSAEDIERFDRDTAFCPDCGAEIWDQVEFCPECSGHLPDGPQRMRPDELQFQKKWLAVVIALVAIGLVLWFAF